MNFFLMLGAVVLFLFLSLFQFIVGYMGIEHHFGTFGAIAALIGLFFFRFTIPFTIGAFFGAVNVLGLNWFFGFLIALPGVAFIIPSALVIILAPISKRYNLDRFVWKPKPRKNKSPFDDGDVIEGTATVVKDDSKDKK